MSKIKELQLKVEQLNMELKFIKRERCLIEHKHRNLKFYDASCKDDIKYIRYLCLDCGCIIQIDTPVEVEKQLNGLIKNLFTVAARLNGKIK